MKKFLTIFVASALVSGSALAQTSPPPVDKALGGLTPGMIGAITAVVAVGIAASNSSDNASPSSPPTTTTTTTTTK